MKTSRLYHQRCNLLGQSSDWADQRHLQTLVWMVIGVICSECISLTKWGIYVNSRAKVAQSHQRRFSRWLHNSRINVQRLYSRLIGAALVNWGVSEISLIEDTTMLWDEYCLIRLSIQYRGRAIPLVWRVLRHGSSSVCFEVYQGMLKRAARLIPEGVSVRFLADRGFANTQLMRYLRDELQWHFRIRVKSNAWIYRPHRGWKRLNQYHLAAGESILLHGITLNKSRPLSDLNLALGRDPLSGQLWFVATNEPASLQTFQQYSERFQLEEELRRRKIQRLSTRTLSNSLCPSVVSIVLCLSGDDIAPHGARAASRGDGQTPLGRCSLESRQQLFSHWLELAQGLLASRLASISHPCSAWRS